MNSGEGEQPGHQRGSSPNRFLFVSSDGLHHTLKKDVRAHVSRYVRREARSRVSPNLHGTLPWGFQQPAGPAPNSRIETAQKAERHDEAPVVLSQPSGSSPDSGYDSTSSDLPQDGVADPLVATQHRLSSMLVADDDTQVGDQHVEGDSDAAEVAVNNFPPHDQSRVADLVGVTAYTGDMRVMRPLGRRALPQTNSAWSAVDSMPLDPFDSLPLRLNHTDQKVLLSCEFVIQLFNEIRQRSFVSDGANTTPNAVQIIPGAVYQVPGSRSINNCRDWAFPLIVKTPMLIYAAMAVVAAGREMRMGVQHSPTTLAYKSCHIRTLNQLIRNPTKRHSAEVLIGVSALIASEHYRGWSPSLFLHVRAFSQILRARGGWSSFNDDPKSGWFLFGQATMWSQVTVASLLGAEDTFPAFRPSVTADIQDLLQARDDLLQLLSSWILWARRRANSAITDFDNQGRYNHFLGENALLFKLLHSPDYLKSARARTAEVEQSHQAFAIIYLVLTKWEHRDRPQDFLTFLDELVRQMRVHDVNKTSTTIPLVWLLIRGVDAWPQRKMQALELLKVLHVLQPELKDRLLKFMLRLLLLDPSSSAVLFSFENLGALDRAVALTFPLEDATSTD